MAAPFKTFEVKRSGVFYGEFTVSIAADECGGRNEVASNALEEQQRTFIEFIERAIREAIERANKGGGDE